MFSLRNVLYVIWALIPIGFLLLALWAKLEQVGSKGGKHGRQAKDFVNQFAFVTVCVLLSILIDQYVLEALVSAVVPPSIPLGFFQVLLLPAVLYAGALAFGGSKPEHIKKAPQVSKNRSGKR